MKIQTMYRFTIILKKITLKWPSCPITRVFKKIVKLLTEIVIEVFNQFLFSSRNTSFFRCTSYRLPFILQSNFFNEFLASLIIEKDSDKFRAICSSKISSYASKLNWKWSWIISKHPCKCTGNPWHVNLE